MKTYLYLLGAILCEVAATSALQASNQFTRPLPTMVMAVGYAAAFYLLSLTLRGMPVAVAYAIWSGLGMVLIAVIGVVWFRQNLDLPAIAGIALIITGVLVMNLMSRSVHR